jgi:hypothetical protein
LGVKSVLGLDPLRLARDVLGSAEDKQRRVKMAERRAIYEDDSEAAIKNEITRIFNDHTVKARAYQFAPLAKSFSLAKRIINEKARPVYVVPPVRAVKSRTEQDRLASIANETALDDKLSSALAYALAQNHAFLQTRYVERFDKIVLGVIPADCVSVIPDPDDPHRELAIMYDKRVWRNGEWVTWVVYWDDEVRFDIDEHGNKVVPKGGEKHALGRIPFTHICPVPRVSGQYWNTTSNDDLFATQKAGNLMTLLGLRKLKARGFPSMVVSGDIRGFPKGQLLDEEVPLQAPEGTSIQDLQNEATADNYLTMLDALESRAAANNGISRARMNQEKDGDDTGLMEQRSEMIKVMRPVELAQFEVFKAVSQEYPDESRRLPLDAEMSIDFGELTVRVDPKAELEVWDMRRKMGVANVLDQIKSSNPEIRDDKEAWNELEQNMEAEAEFIKRRRALNVSEQADNQQPGQSPEANGAMGPKVRDNEMTKDEAADQATGGPPEDDDEDPAEDGQ